MKVRVFIITTLALLTVSISLAGCIPPAPADDCMFTQNTLLTAYRLPDDTSDVFGYVPVAEAYKVLARTADGWVGFDPGVAQAGNIGLAHHRWVQLNAIVSPSCLTSVDLVTLADVQADVDASTH
ncbi:MAG: hypothetical protein K8R91_02740 [Phycisphaerae bacterium]|nr:hypothetical protein [Phycisphaerae bacterium]